MNGNLSVSGTLTATLVRGALGQGIVGREQLDAALAAQLVTNGDKHDHSGGNGAQIKHSSLYLDGGTNPHNTTAADVSALSLTGGTISGDLQVTGSGFFSRNVGIGTIEPNCLLTIQGSAGAYMNVKGNGGQFEVRMGADRHGGFISTMTSHDLQLGAGGDITKVTIKANGKVGIGTTDPEFMLDVTDRMRVRQGANTAGIWFYQSEPKNDRAFVGMASDNQVGFWGSTGAHWGLVMDTTTGNVGIGIGTQTPQCKLHVNGTVRATGFVPPSDVRLKTNIMPLTNVLEKLDQIRTVSFEWNHLSGSLSPSTGRREVGVIAQEVEVVFPELVTSGGEDNFKGVDYGRLAAVLMEGVKELKAENKALRQRIERLEKSQGNEEPRV